MPDNRLLDRRRRERYRQFSQLSQRQILLRNATPESLDLLKSEVGLKRCEHVR